ncbi:MAG TPA: ammonia-forming cytochrome c nitrite reductase subunit c552, partial [Bacillota bacterium]|nr:ammonia-forming cytochrome c nitrite reductase subunit c552 [Bacillota bacterium]
MKPSSLKSGIPKGERILGLVCISTLLVTGLYLTWYRLDSFSAFFQSHFGILLFVKLILFLTMLTVALLAVTIIHSRMRRQSSGAPAQKDAFNIQDLSGYDGQDGRPAYVLYKNTVYDVTDSPRWKEGSHFRAHTAGRDLTKDLERAPHEEEVFEGLPVIAKISEGQRLEIPQKLSNVGKLFVGMAYTNSIIVFLILLCVAAWRWGYPFQTGQHEQSRRDMIADTCLGCHEQNKPGIYADWQQSVHAKSGVSCSDCHQVYDRTDPAVNRPHLNNIEIPVSALVTPKRCSQCHPEETKQYEKSKHAHTLEIIN